MKMPSSHEALAQLKWKSDDAVLDDSAAVSPFSSHIQQTRVCQIVLCHFKIPAS